MFGRAFCVGSLLSVLALPASAELVQHGNVILDVPQNWDVARHLHPLLLLRFNGSYRRCSGCFIKIGPGAPAEGSLQQWLESEIPRYVDLEDQKQMEEISVTKNSNPHLSVSKYFIAPNRTFYMIVGVRAGDRFESLSFEAYTPNEANWNTAMEFLQQDVAPLLNGLRFVSEGAHPLPPPPGETEQLNQSADACMNECRTKQTACQFAYCLPGTVCSPIYFAACGKQAADCLAACKP